MEFIDQELDLLLKIQTHSLLQCLNRSTPAGIELNPATEPIEEPVKSKIDPIVEENKTY